MKILLVSPKTPDTFWSFKHALKFISKKASGPPLGLLTVAAMLPVAWTKKLVDLNVSALKDTDILWADYVLISAMSIQKVSVIQIIEKCQQYQRKTIAGGPLFTGEPENFMHIDHLILNEAEITFKQFLTDLTCNSPKKIYRSESYANLQDSPLPDYSLIDASKYAQLNIQYSRGCPFNCEFCEITALLGRRVRTKTTMQIVWELDNIFTTGFRGNVFFVDDNFIGNRKKLKRELLPAIIEWNKSHNHPFAFTTEASIDLSDDPVLLDQMAQAGFEKVFVGIETPENDSLVECNKQVNAQHDMIESVKIIQRAGIEVSAGFIVGFDNDSPDIFKHQIDFIQRSGIITAMVGLLNAPNRTRLYKRLSNEGRILRNSGGDNTNYSMNFIPKMEMDLLLKGYRSIISNIYSSKAYYERLLNFLRDFQPKEKVKPKINFEKVMALIRSVLIIGVFSRSRLYYWKLFFWSLFKKPGLFSMAITYSIYGYHFRKVYGLTH